jgi:hypothetical protein
MNSQILNFEGNIEDHDNLCWILSEIKRTESQINFVLNNIMLKQMTAAKDKLQMLIYVAELMHSASNKSTKKIAKTMMYFAKMYSSIDKESTDHNKFLMGSLYALGGLLKVEAKSYLMTCSEYYKQEPEKNTIGFKLVCPLSNPENPLEDKEKEYIRHLSEDDQTFFRTTFYLIMVQFIKSISTGLHKVVDNSTFNLLLDLTEDRFYDEMKEMERKQPQKLDQILSAHFVSKFCIDVLQFSFAYFVEAQGTKEEPEKRSLYDHRTPIDLTDGKYGVLKLRYINPGFEKIIEQIV